MGTHITVSQWQTSTCFIRTPFLTKSGCHPLDVPDNCYQPAEGCWPDAIGHHCTERIVVISRWGIYSAWDMMMTVVAGEYKVPRALGMPSTLGYHSLYNTWCFASPPIYALPQTLIEYEWSLVCVRHCACDPEWPRFPALSLKQLTGVLSIHKPHSPMLLFTTNQHLVVIFKSLWN